MKRPEIKISIPDELKSQLVDEWENITKKSQVRSTLSSLPLDLPRPTKEANEPFILVAGETPTRT